MDAHARSSDPPSSASLCPGCGKAIDSLRAGHVAILDGAFRYFCGTECKAAFVEVTSRRDALEAMTAEPPRVVESGVREQRPASRVEAEPPSETAAREPSPSPPRVEEPSPLTLRSPMPEPSPLLVAAAPLPEPSAPEPGAPEPNASPPSSAALPTPKLPLAKRASRLAVAGAPVVGIAAGALAAAVSLGGESAAAARLPIALIAVAVVVLFAARRAREVYEPSRWISAGPVALAACVAVIARAAGDPHAGTHATFVGLAAAAVMLAEHLFARARRDVERAGARVASALGVTVRVVRGDEVDVVEAPQVKPGQQVLVEAGEVVGVDGTVAAGNAEIAPWLDSHVVVDKREGDAVVAGSAILRGRLRITATFTGAERAWLRHGAAAARAFGAPPPVLLARRFVERGTPVAALVVAGAVYAGNAAWSDVAIAACAGAHALATGAAVAAAALAHLRGGLAAQQRGIVYKDALAFDTAARADVAVICSRGTVLLGTPEIVAVEAIASGGERPSPAEATRVLALAAGAEMTSPHPFAAAILRAARSRAVAPENVRSAIGHSGLGVTALAPNGDKVIVGSRAFLLQEKVSVALADARVSELEAEGRSVLLVAVGGKLAGLLALQDGLRPGARAAVQRLHDARIEPVLLSGEARDTVETIARSLAVEHVRPEVLPADRAAEVRALAEGGHVVAAVGHASSDDGALGAADVAVAMSAAGRAPGEWGVVLASDDVRDAALALTVPRACRDRAKAALVVGGVSQALAVLGIAFGIAPPVAAPLIVAIAAPVLLAMVREPTAAITPKA
jgi:P-type Cu+ transporter